MDQDLPWFLFEPVFLPALAVLVAMAAYWIRESRARAQWSRDEVVSVRTSAASAYRDESDTAIYHQTAADPRAPAEVRSTAFWSFVALGNMAGVYLFLAIGIPFYVMSHDSGDMWLVSAVVAIFMAPPALLLASWSRRLRDARPSVAREAGPWLGLLGTPPSLLLGLVLCHASWPTTLLVPLSFVAALAPIPAILGRRKAVDQVFELWRDRGYEPENAREDEMPMRTTPPPSADGRARTERCTGRDA